MDSLAVLLVVVTLGLLVVWTSHPRRRRRKRDSLREHDAGGFGVISDLDYDPGFYIN